MNRTYRATVRGRFEDLTDAQRRRLRDDQDAHGMFAAKFTPDGTFLYAPELIGYEFRYLLSIEEESPEDADLAARLEAEEAAANAIRDHGFQGRITGIGLVCLEDVKIRGRTRT